MNQQILYPYLVPGLMNPDYEYMCPEIGHGIRIWLSEDRESDAGIVHAYVYPDKLRESGLSVEEAHRIALANLDHFVETTEKISMKMLGNPGDPFNFLLFCEHPRASACLLLPHLYENAQRFLQSDEILACAPQREALIVFPKRDRAYREALVTRLREIEGGARKLITFDLFELTADGVRPFVEAE